MVAKLLLQNVFFVVAMGALLFASAGTLHWPGAWALLATSAVLGPACGLWLAKTDPALLAERMRLTAREEQPAADKKFMLVFAATALLWLVAMGLDRRIQPPAWRGHCRRWALRCTSPRQPSSCGCFARTPLRRP